MSKIKKYVEGFKELYQADSDNGVVTSCDRFVKTNTGIRHYKSRPLKPELTNAGYHRVVLCNAGTNRRMSVHRIIAETFIMNPDSLPEVNHKNGDKTDNRAANLEWVTTSENQKHAYANNLKNIESTKVANSIPVNMYDKETNALIKSYSSMTECSLDTGRSIPLISLHCKNKVHPRKYQVYFRFSNMESNDYPTGGEIPQ